MAQAAYTAAEFDRFESGHLEVPDGQWSRDHYTTSLAALRDSHPRRAFFSHDPRVWERAERGTATGEPE